ncbi:MAG: pantoate--beta-alanine ligase, partial [Planctomycetia bacterium]
MNDAKDLVWIVEPAVVRRRIEEAKRNGLTVGLVPTMGNLHAGHARLIETARSENDFVVATLFVNPTQFGPTEDFARYPRTPDDDRRLAAAAGADVLFAPLADAMYPPGSSTVVRVD